MSRSRSRARKKPFSRRLFTIARVVHVYLSMGLFSLLLLFCVTGILLNHSQWLSGGRVDGSRELIVPEHISMRLAKGASDVFTRPPLAEIQAYLLQNHNLKKVSDISLDEESGEIIFDYKLPAGYAAVVVDVNLVQMTLDYRKGSIGSLVNDLHKGRNSGPVWSWVIDLSAGFMVFFSITGMVILFQNRKYKRMGLVLAMLGTLSPLCVYWFFVPRLTGV